MLDGLDAHRIIIDVQRTGRFTWGRADAAGKVREVVGGVQHFDRTLPVLAIYQIVPVRDDVVDRAAALAERDAAIHATRTLRLGVLVGQMQDKLLVVLDALLDGQVALFQTLKL